jgi:hypothetical protein
MTKSIEKSKLTLLVLLSTLLSCCLYYLEAGLTVFLLPVVVLGCYYGMKSSHIALDPSKILSSIIFVLFVLDDTAAVPWVGKSALTSTLGDVVFRSYGLTGFEILFMLFTLAVILMKPVSEIFYDLKNGLAYSILLSLSIFILCIVSALKGTTSGGELYVAAYQIRYTHMMLVYSTLGFLCLEDLDKFTDFLKALCLALIFKAHQGVFMNFIHYSFYRRTEFLVTHFYSAFVPLALCFIYYQLCYMKPSRLLKWIYLSSIPSFLLTFIVNDRRTAYAATALAFVGFILATPLESIKRHRLKILSLASAALVCSFVCLLLFISMEEQSSYQTYIKKELPLLAYRKLENANLLNFVTKEPFTGSGFGKAMDNVFGLVDISRYYPRYLTVPHNQLLAMWGYGGSYVFAALSLILSLMLAYSMRPYHQNWSPKHKSIGSPLFFFYVQYLVFTMADLGYQMPKMQMLAGLCLGGFIKLYYRDDQKGLKRYVSR